MFEFKQRINNAHSIYRCFTAAKERKVQIFVLDYIEHLSLLYIYILEVKSGVLLADEKIYFIRYCSDYLL